MSTPVSGFFAYASDAATAETISKAVVELNAGGVVRLTTWENLRVGGKLIINAISKAIDERDVFCADITSLNPNIMFELGYAIAQNKRIWLIYDPTLPELNANFEKLRILTTVGYAKYENSHDIVRKFLNERPYEDLTATVFAEVIKPMTVRPPTESILYLKSRHNSDASVVLSNKIDKAAKAARTQLVLDDPRESSVQPLAWYGEQVYNAAAVVCHFVSPTREGALLHNARYALVAGLAHGMRRPLLMLAHGTFPVPIDYRDLLKQYQTAAEATTYLQEWITPALETLQHSGSAKKAFVATIEMAQQLSAIRIGDPIAENEAERLKDDYFIETSAYREALEGRQTIFVGRKGAGKSAALIKLSSVLSNDRRNLVCIIKPIAYEFHGIVQLLTKYRESDIKGYAIESLWKFLIYSEIANAAVASIKDRPSQAIESHEIDLVALLEQNAGLLGKDFSVRLERCVESLLPTASKVEGGVEARRMAISEALHSGTLKLLRDALSKALSPKDRVAVLVDNLDKAWNRHSDIETLTEFLLGLLKAANRITNDFRSVSATQKSVNVSLAVFVRADIFHRVASVARERDKIPYTKMIWSDETQLLRVIDERFASSVADMSGDPEAIWKRFFVSEVRQMPVKEYIVSQILPRPRDLLFLMKAAISTAVNRKHSQVTEDDILTAQRQYSQFAVDSILVENGVSLSKFEELLYEFAGRNVIQTRQQVGDILRKSGIAPSEENMVVDHLCELSFLGRETEDEVFRFAEDEKEARKIAVLARNLADANRSSPRFRVNVAFCPFLEIQGC